ncbi:pyridoxamine 5'-phosphate oxidase family protein [Kineococcus arenarius]|uniref:pyridoxamine 5'-phosphate oxidase family protein n=1 Tax=Kineococcus sp. SYSU DK007 TaxID=3383128 RepID=UPI003D7DD094
MSQHRPLTRATGTLLGLALRSAARRRTDTNPANILASARAVMSGRTYCTLITSGEQGPSARVVEPLGPDADLALRVGTSTTSRKARQAASSHSALLAYESHRDRAGVIAHCTADLISDRALCWQWFSPTWRAFWPAGPDDKDFMLIRCFPHLLEVWDVRRGVTPEPFGLRSARIQRDGDTWVPAHE